MSDNEVVAPFIALSNRVKILEDWVTKTAGHLEYIADHWESVNRQMEDHAVREKRDRWHATYNAVIGPLVTAMMGVENEDEGSDTLVVDFESAHESATIAANLVHGELPT